MSYGDSDDEGLSRADRIAINQRNASMRDAHAFRSAVVREQSMQSDALALGVMQQAYMGAQEAGRKRQREEAADAQRAAEAERRRAREASMDAERANNAKVAAENAAISAQSEDVQVLLDQGKEEVRQNHFAPAKIKYQNALSILNGDVLSSVHSAGLRRSRGDAYFNFGFCCAMLEETEDAIKYFTSALRVDSTMVDALYCRGVAHTRMNKLALAKADFEAAIALNRDHIRAEMYLLFVTKQWAGLIEKWPSFAKRESKFSLKEKVDFRYIFAIAEYEMGHYDKAIECCTAAVGLLDSVADLASTKPKLEKLYTLRGNVYKAQNKVDEARVEYAEARRVNPQNPMHLIFTAEAEGAPVSKRNAQFQLAVAFHDGSESIPEDYVKAREWYTKAADLGHGQAAEFLGIMFENGLGCRKNLHKAFEAYKQAVANGYAPAAYHVARMCDATLHAPDNAEQVRENYQIASDAGIEKAHYPCARLFHEVDARQAQKYYRKVLAIADSTDVGATHFYLGELHRRGGPNLPADPITMNAVRCYAKAIEHRFFPDIEGCFACGIACIGVDNQVAVTFLQKVVNQTENVEHKKSAAVHLAQMYETGGHIGVSTNLDQARKYYKIASDLGDQDAYFKCAHLHHDINNQEAAVHYKKIISLPGHVNKGVAANNLGMIYRDGRTNVPKNEEEARKYFKIASDLGYQDAYFQCAYLHHNVDKAEAAIHYKKIIALPSPVDKAGAARNLALLYKAEGPMKNLDEAKKYFKISSELGNADATKELKDMESSSCCIM